MTKQSEYIKRIEKEFFYNYEKKHNKNNFIKLGWLFGWLIFTFLLTVAVIQLNITLGALILIMACVIWYFERKMNHIMNIVFYQLHLNMRDRINSKCLIGNMASAFPGVKKIQAKDYCPSELEQFLWGLYISTSVSIFNRVLSDVLTSKPLHFIFKFSNKNNYTSLLIVSEENTASLIIEPHNLFGFDTQENFHGEDFKRYEVIHDHNMDLPIFKFSCFWYEGMLTDILDNVEYNEHENITFEIKRKNP